MSSSDNEFEGSSLEEYGLSISDKELSQKVLDEELRAKAKVCPICNTEYFDNSYFGEQTCGDKFCNEEYEKIHGKKSRMKKTRYYDIFTKKNREKK
jgi:hypothetical protein